jgi:peroxiredoxin
MLALLTVMPERSGASSARAPEFSLRDLQGATIQLRDFNDRVVILAFWATWCKPCMSELKALDRLYREHHTHGLTVFGINIDGPETRGKVTSVAKRYRLSFPILTDREQRVVRLYNPRVSVPFSAVIDRGMLVMTKAGFQASDIRQLEADLAALLK